MLRGPRGSARKPTRVRPVVRRVRRLPARVRPLRPDPFALLHAHRPRRSPRRSNAGSPSTPHGDVATAARTSAAPRRTQDVPVGSRPLESTPWPPLPGHCVPPAAGPRSQVRSPARATRTRPTSRLSLPVPRRRQAAAAGNRHQAAGTKAAGTRRQPGARRRPGVHHLQTASGSRELQETTPANNVNERCWLATSGHRTSEHRRTDERPVRSR